MISASGLSSALSASGTGVQGIGLESQLGRLQQQLSDCVNCPTANTTEGKTKIQSVSDQISAIKSRMEQAAQQVGNNNQVPDIQALAKLQPGLDNRPIPGAAIGGVINISV